jgi:hypothetical protein
MRFLVQPGAEALGRARPPVRAFLLFAGLALAGLVAQRGASGALTPAGVLAFYLPGGDALPQAALWEEAHACSFVYGLVLFMAGSLLAVSPVSPRARAVLFGAALGFAVADLAAPFVVVASGGLGALRVVTTLGAAGSLAAALAVVARSFGRPGRTDGA